MYHMPQQLMNEVGYFINEWLSITGFGGEYSKMANLVIKLYNIGIKFDRKYYHIWQVVYQWKKKN